MYLAKIKKKSQVTVPAPVMKTAGLRCGGYVEFIVEQGKISFHSKRLVDLRDELLLNKTEPTGRDDK